MKNTKALNQADADRAIQRIKSLVQEGCRYSEICEVLRSEGYKTIKGQDWTENNLRVLMFRLRHKARSFYAISQRRTGFVPCRARDRRAKPQKEVVFEDS
jgi:hypothetical protein